VLLIGTVAVLAVTAIPFGNKLLLGAIGFGAYLVETRRPRPRIEGPVTVNQSGRWSWDGSRKYWTVNHARNLGFAIQVTLQSSARQRHSLLIWRDAISDSEFHELATWIRQDRIQSARQPKFDRSLRQSVSKT